jgi:ATP-dependent protease ClpP protease subunit
MKRISPVWMSESTPLKKRRMGGGPDDDEDGGGNIIQIPLSLPNIKAPASTTIYSQMNHVYFNDDITTETAFALNRELRNAELQARFLGVMTGQDPLPVVLHITTNGGCIHSAFTVVDTIKSLRTAVHTVVEGFVASAGTIISLAGETRFIAQNAYMLIHELRSGVWGKMSSLEEEYDNLRKIAAHIMDYYVDNTLLKKKDLKVILKKDVIWNADESIANGLVDQVWHS